MRKREDQADRDRHEEGNEERRLRGWEKVISFKQILHVAITKIVSYNLEFKFVIGNWSFKNTEICPFVT